MASERDIQAEETLNQYKDNPAVQQLMNDEDFKTQVMIGGYSSVVDGDYILPKDLWGKSQKERMASGVHLNDGGEVGGTIYGKLPNHPTFSTESPFSNEVNTGGVWTIKDGRDMFTPSDYMKQDAKRMDYLKNNYWKSKEPNGILNL